MIIFAEYYRAERCIYLITNQNLQIITHIFFFFLKYIVFLQTLKYGFIKAKYIKFKKITSEHLKL